jgi:hypothetical protein
VLEFSEILWNICVGFILVPLFLCPSVMEVHRSNAKYQECVSILSIEMERSVEFNDTVGY